VYPPLLSTSIGHLFWAKRVKAPSMGLLPDDLLLAYGNFCCLNSESSSFDNDISLKSNSTLSVKVSPHSCLIKLTKYLSFSHCSSPIVPASSLWLNNLVYDYSKTSLPCKNLKRLIITSPRSSVSSSDFSRRIMSKK